MMSKRELEKWRKTCLSKDPFATREAADRGAKRMSKRHGIATRAYACPYCSNWHLTTREPRASQVMPASAGKASSSSNDGSSGTGS